MSSRTYAVRSVAMRGIDVFVEVPHEVGIAGAVADELVEILDRHACAIEETRRQAAVRDVLARVPAWSARTLSAIRASHA